MVRNPWVQQNTFDTEEWIHICTIITGEPSVKIAKIHTRMPVILSAPRSTSGPKGLSRYRPSVFSSGIAKPHFTRSFRSKGRGPDPRWASATCLQKVKPPAERVLHIYHLFAHMQRLNTTEAKTNAMTRIGSNLSQVLPPPFSCE